MCWSSEVITVSPAGAASTPAASAPTGAAAAWSMAESMPRGTCGGGVMPAGFVTAAVCRAPQASATQAPLQALRRSAAATKQARLRRSQQRFRSLRVDHEAQRVLQVEDRVVLHVREVEHQDHVVAGSGRARHLLQQAVAHGASCGRRGSGGGARRRGPPPGGSASSMPVVLDAAPLLLDVEHDAGRVVAAPEAQVEDLREGPAGEARAGSPLSRARASSSPRAGRAACVPRGRRRGTRGPLGSSCPCRHAECRGASSKTAKSAVSPRRLLGYSATIQR